MNKGEIKIINLVKLYAVLLLAESPRYGYEMIKQISKKLERNISPGQIYPFLTLMEKKGLLIHGASGERDKKVYSLTAQGRIFARKMMVRFGDLIDVAIEPRLTSCTHCGCKIYSGYHKEAINGKELTFCCKHCARSFRH